MPNSKLSIHTQTSQTGEVDMVVETTGNHVSGLRSSFDRHGGKDKAETAEVTRACDAEESSEDERQGGGVSRKMIRIAYAVILITSLVESFAQDSTSDLAAYVTSSFNAHSMISTAQIVYKITAVCAYPILGKVADLLGRGEGFCLTMIMYTLCYVLFATCKRIGEYFVGQVFFAIGRIGFKTYLYIFIADTTSLINRGFWTQFPAAITGIPSTYAGSHIQDAFLDHSTWRWAYGTFAIILAGFIAPLSCVMFYVDHVQRKNGKRRKPTILMNLPEGSLMQKLKKIFLLDLDLIGGFLLLAGTILFFVPFTITGKTSPKKWNQGSTIAMLIIGFILLVLFVLWCAFPKRLPWLQTRQPFIPIQAFTNMTVLIAFLMVALDYCENAAFNVYFSTVLQVGGYYTAGQAARINDAKKTSIDIASILTGLMMKYTKRTKIFVLTGVPLLVLGHGLLVWFIDRDGVMEENTVLLYVMEIFCGVGRALYMTALQVTIQAIAGATSVAMSTAFFLAFTSVGTLIGTAISGVIWNNVAIDKLHDHLPDELQKNATMIFKNFKLALKMEEGTPGRLAVSLAYRETLQIIGWFALAVIIPMLGLMFFVREVELTDKHDIYGSDQETLSSNSKFIDDSVLNKEKRTWSNWWRV